MTRRLQNLFATSLIVVCFVSSTASALDGQALSAGVPMDGAELSLWAANGHNQADKLESVIADSEGKFSFASELDTDQNLYVTAASGPVTQMLILGKGRPDTITLNELTTLASAFTGARFLTGTNFHGNDLGLRIAAGNVKNFVNPVTGGWGDTLLNGNNSSLSTTLARLNTMGNLLALCGIEAQEQNCETLLEFDTTDHRDTLGVAQSIARAPWDKADALFALFEKSYVAPKSENPQERRAGVTYLPYLSWAPDDFALSLKFTGGGYFAAGRITFDAEGNMWSGQNWMPGSQSGAIRGIGGGLTAMRPDGTPISPPIHGFTGMNVDGVGWGTGTSDKAVWITSFSNVIGVFDFNGQPLGPEEGITFDGKFGQGQGVGIGGNGDVWIADSSRDQLAHFPGGDHTKGELIKVDGAFAAPFAVQIDDDNNVWVTNSRGYWVTRFPADDPQKAVKINVGLGVRGLGIDSQGNAWVASNMTQGFPAPEFPDGEVTIMKEFEIAYNNLMANGRHLPTGTVHMIPKGSDEAQLVMEAAPGLPLNVPWGVSIDGEDNVWVANFLGTGLLKFCGATPENCKGGSETGDFLHYFRNGNTQLVTDASIDPAGNIWYANNWNEVTAVADRDPDRALSTKAGGDGVNIFYGIAAPVKTPLMGAAQSPE